MNSWYELELGDAIIAQAEMERIRESYLRFKTTTGGNNIGTVHLQYRTFASLHCKVTAFFSPDASAFARHMGATACLAPSPQGLELFLGGV